MKIGFVGSMNAMPMGYALNFQRDGFDVKYIVESEPENQLMRPENHFAKKVSYPYPPWIIEVLIPYSLVGHAFARFTYTEIFKHMNDRDVIFLNDFGMALAPHFSATSILVALCSGSDLDVFCNYSAALGNAIAGRRKWLFPFTYVLNVLRTFNQKRGLKRCNIVSYFPTGLNRIGDALIEEYLKKHKDGVFIPRYDINFSATGIKFKPIINRDLTKILVPVRFNMNPSKGTSFEYKGNDIIIKALAKYQKKNARVEIIFFTKGSKDDIKNARQMCVDNGLSENVQWLEPVTLEKLLEYYYDCDVCIDQVGSHWMGAVGAYALYSGRPLITNARPEVFDRFWGTGTPILQASTIDDILKQLIRCEDINFRKEISIKSHNFAVNYLDSESVYREIVASLKNWSQGI